MLYLYCVDFNEDKNKVTINQALNTISELGKSFDLFFLIPWHSKKNIYEVFDNYGIKKNFKIVRIPKIPGKHLFFLQANRLVYSCFSLLYIKIKSFHYIYTRDFSFIYFISIFWRFVSIRGEIVFEIHKIYHKTSEIVNFKQEKKAYKVVDLFVATTKKCKSDLNEYFNIKKNNVIVTPNGVNLNYFNNIDKGEKELVLDKYGIEDDDNVLIYSGSFIWWKGVDTLVKSLYYVENEKIKLLLVGGFGEDFEKIKELVKKYNLQSKVVLTGYLKQEEIIKILKKAQVGVIPNNKSPEGESYTSPIKLYEYMASGLAVIASELPSIREVLDEKGCLFFEVENEEDLAKKIDYLFSHPDLIEEMSEYNKEKVKEYTWENKVNKINEFINNR